MIVVGAGLAGLTRRARSGRPGKSVLVMEAQNRVGGRTLSEDIGGGEIADLGGTFIGPTQDHIAALVKELGIPTFPTYNTGNNVFIRSDGRREEFASNTPAFGTAPPDPEIAPDIVAAVAQLDDMAAEIDVKQPWAHPNAARVGLADARQLAARRTRSGNKEFMASSPPPASRSSAPRRARSRCSTRSSTSPRRATSRTRARSSATSTPQGGAQETRIEGGAQLISIKMAQQLGKRVLLKAPVRRIDQGRFGVRVWTDKYYVLGQARDRRDAARDRRPDHLPRRHDRPARPADAAHPAGHAAQVRGDLRQAVLARQEPVRPVHLEHRPDQGRPSTRRRRTARPA